MKSVSSKRRTSRIWGAAELMMLALATLALFCLPARADQDPVRETQPTVLGDTVLRGDASNRLRVVVWYPGPAETSMRPIDIGPAQRPYFFSEGAAALDVPLAATPTRLPLIALSPEPAERRWTAWLCAGLAAHGFIVASVDHPENNALDPPTIAGTKLWWLRATDLSRVTDGVLTEPRFASRIDRTRIDAVEFSNGGYTVLDIAGARANPRALEEFCKREPALMILKTREEMKWQTHLS